MQRPAVVVLIACPLLLAATGSRAVQRSADDPRFSPAAVAEYERREAAIAHECEAKDAPDWAGAYYLGIGTGVNKSLAIAPGAGFAFRSGGCAGPGDRNFGEVRLDGNRIFLIPEFPNVRSTYDGVATELVRVRWGDRMYLVAADEMMDFVGGVNSGMEPRTSMWGWHYLRRGDDRSPVHGMPRVPASYERFFLTEPVVSRVVAVTSETDPDPDDPWRGPVDVVVDRGSESRLYEGLRIFVESTDRPRWFRLTEVRNRPHWFRLTEVGIGRSVARANWIDLDDPLPVVGAPATTRLR